MAHIRQSRSDSDCRSGIRLRVLGIRDEGLGRHEISGIGIEATLEGVLDFQENAGKRSGIRVCGLWITDCESGCRDQGFLFRLPNAGFHAAEKGMQPGRECLNFGRTQFSAGE